MERVEQDRRNDTWSEPAVPAVETAKPHDVQQVLRADARQPAETLMHASDYDLGTDALDSSRYYSKAFHDLEVSKMWNCTWQMAAWSHDLPAVGDIGVYTLIDRSVLIVRQPDMTFKALVNSCLHRGRELCRADTHRDQLRCPYHGFTWSLNGSLKYIPAQWDFPQIDPSEFGLPEVRIDEWNGFIFVNFDPDARPLREYMGAMFEQWGGDNPRGAWNFKEKYKAAHLYREINCNWKVCMEGFIESFHVLASHPQAGAMVPESSCQYDVYPDEPHFSRMHSLFGVPSSGLEEIPSEQEVLDSFTSTFMPHLTGMELGALQPNETARQALVRLSRESFSKSLNMDLSGFADAELIDGTEYFLFPNILPWPSILTPLFYRFRPKGDDPDWCIWETMLFLPFEGERPPSCEVTVVELGKSFEDYGKMGPFDLVLQQDADQLPRVQRGLKAGATQKVTLAKYQEARIRHFHQTLDVYLNR